MWNWKFGNENFELKIWILKDTWKLLAKFKCRDQNFGSHFLVSSLFFFASSSSTFLPPLALFTSFFLFIFLLHLTISSHKKHFSKLLHLPLSISINISLDLCILSIFITQPFLVKPIFQNPFSLHQNGFFLQGIFFSCFSW